MDSRFDQAEFTPLKIGFYFGGVSGPGSGSHTRLLSLVSALAPSNLEIYLYGNIHQLEGFASTENICLRPHNSRSRLLRILTSGRTVRRLSKSDDLDFMHFETLPIPTRLTCKVIFSIHHLEVPGHKPIPYFLDWARTRLRLRAHKKAAKRSDRIITLTSWSRSDIMKRLGVSGEKIVAVPFCIQPERRTPDYLPDNDSLIIKDPFVLALGHLELRKNLEVLIEACANEAWPQGHSLVLAGSDHGQRGFLEKLAVDLDVEVIFTGPVSESTKWALLSQALCLAMPSTLEGFGIPVIEAISVGTPALVSDRTALPEVAGTPDAVVDANDAYAWASKIRSLAADPQNRMDLLGQQQRGLSRFYPETEREIYVNQVLPAVKSDHAPLHILHLAYGGIGGHRGVIEELSKALSPSGLRSSALLLGPQDLISSKEKATGIDGLPYERYIPIRRRADISSMYQVYRSTRKLRPFCVLAHSHRHVPAAWLGMIVSRRRPKIILVEHQSVSLRTWLDNFNSALAVLFSRDIVFLTTNYRDSYQLRWLLRLLRKRHSVIPNGIQIQEMQKNWLVTTSGPRVLGMASRLISSKNISSLIRTMPLLEDQGSWILRIAGEGPERGHLQELVEQMDLSSVVQFDGPIDRSKMPDWYLSLDCYVHPSRGETMSMSIVEAASFGVPIVATDDAGIREVFNPDLSVWLISETTPEGIAEGVSELFSSNEFQIRGSAGRSTVVEHFSSKTMAERYLDLLGESGAIPQWLFQRTRQALRKPSK